jgi:DNA repair protein RadA/Sms
MSKKEKQIYVCQKCGYNTSRWLGKCPDCGEWNTFAEERIAAKKNKQGGVSANQPISLSQIKPVSQNERILTGIGEFDRVLGGGIFPSSVILIAGDPGIGKSTLMLQASLKMVSTNQKVLYISAEESLQQIKMRSERLNHMSSDLSILAATNLEEIIYQLEKIKPVVVVIDSIQSIYHPELSGAPGNLSQVRECAAKLFQFAKENSCSLFLVGHVTKEGAVAGPKILEHLVDVVIYFEGNMQQHRIIRSLKNRFGASNEIGLFEMFSDGLREVTETWQLFLTHHQGPVVGSSISCSYEGSRPLLVEVQGLVGRSNYGTPQRTVSGFDYRRLSLILAVLEKYSKQNFGTYDVFVKIAGGLRIDDPAIDLAVAAALFSSRNNIPLDNHSIYIGELGLGGDIRPVSFTEKRLQEAQKMGFKNVYLSSRASRELTKGGKNSLQIHPLDSVHQLFKPYSNE